MRTPAPPCPGRRSPPTPRPSSPVPALYRLSPLSPRPPPRAPWPALTLSAALQSQASSKAATEPIHGPSSARRPLPGPRRPRPPILDLCGVTLSLSRGGKAAGTRLGRGGAPSGLQSNPGAPGRARFPRVPGTRAWGARGRSTRVRVRRCHLPAILPETRLGEARRPQTLRAVAEGLPTSPRPHTFLNPSPLSLRPLWPLTIYLFTFGAAEEGLET